MQFTQMITTYLLLSLAIPNLAHAENTHSTVIFLSASIVFLMFLTVYVVYKIRRSLRNDLDKSAD